MEPVNRYIIPFQGSRSTIQITGNTFLNINIPISLDFSNMGQRDLIDREFVKVEEEKAINPIIDYEKTKFKPIHNGVSVNNLTYYLHLDGPTIPSTLDQLGYEYDDVKYNLNAYKKSFLRLYFYDSIITTDQNLIFIIDLFPEIYEEDKLVTPFDIGKPKPLNQIDAKLQCFNGNKFLDRSSDGYNLYYYKDVLTKNTSLDLYMRAEFFNAKTGKISKNMNTGSSVDIMDLKDNLFTKYTLERNSLGNIYTIDTSQQNVSYDSISNSYKISLYNILVD